MGNQKQPTKVVEDPLNIDSQSPFAPPALPPIIRPMMEWNLRSNVADVLSLGPRTSAKLLRLGVQSVEHLLVAKPHLLSVRLADERIDWKTIACWQREVQLSLSIPQLNACATRLLAVAEFSSLGKIAHCSPTELIAALEQLPAEQKKIAGRTDEGLPDFAEVSDWIACAQKNLRDRAA